jgi:hypothetical protein
VTTNGFVATVAALQENAQKNVIIKIILFIINLSNFFILHHILAD